MIASTTHLEKPVINNHTIEVVMEIDGWSLSCTDCGAKEMFGDTRDAEDWADSHLCPWAFCYCGFAAFAHVDGMHTPYAVEPITVTNG